MGPQFNEGEIAITTNTKFSENRGKVVRLKEYLGRRHWPWGEGEVVCIF